MRESNVTSDDEVDFVLVDNSTETGNVVTLGNHATQSTRENVVPVSVPHNLENIPVGYEFNNFVMNRVFPEDFLHDHGDTEENRNNLGQESDEFLDLPERQSNSSDNNTDNSAQNEGNTSETEIVDSLQEDHNLNNVDSATAVADIDDDFNDVDYDDEPSSSETDEEFIDNNSDFDSDESDFHDLIEIHFVLIVLW